MEGQYVARIGFGDDLDQIVGIVDVGVTDLDDDIVTLEPGLVGGSILRDILYDGAGFNAGDVGGLFRQGRYCDADVGLQNIAVFDDAGDDTLDAVDGDGETDVV